MITQEDIKPILGGVQKALSYTTLEPFVKISEQRFIDEFGKALFTYLSTTPTVPEQVESHTELKDLAKPLILWQAYTIAQPHVHIKVGDGGMVKNSPQNTVAVTKWEYTKLEESNITMVDFYFEAFYKSLDTISPDSYTSSPNFISRSELTINTAHAFTRSFPLLNNSVRLFTKLKTYIRLTEAQLKVRFTPDVFTTLSTSIYKEKLFALIAHQAIYEALPYLNILMDADGIRVVIKTDSNRNEIQAQTADRVDLRHKVYNDAKTAAEEIMQHLYATSSPTQYVTFYNTFVKDSITNTSQDDDPLASPIL